MDTLMIIILLALTLEKGSDKVGVAHQTELGVTTMEHCQKTKKALAETPPDGLLAIVICRQAKAPASAPAKPAGKGREA